MPHTVTVKLDGEDSDAALIPDTLTQYLLAITAIVENAYLYNLKSISRIELYDRTDPTVCEQTRLQATLDQLDRDRSTETNN